MQILREPVAVAVGVAWADGSSTDGGVEMMRFTVDTSPNGRSRAISTGPQFMCHYGDEDCAFYAKGPCTRFPCSCETEGVVACRSCPTVPGKLTVVRRVP